MYQTLLKVLGEIKMKVHQGGNEARLPLLVVEGCGPSLLGRNWLAQLQLDWKEIHTLHQTALSQLLENYAGLFLPARSGNSDRSQGQKYNEPSSTAKVLQSAFSPVCNEGASRWKASPKRASLSPYPRLSERLQLYCTSEEE